MSETVVIYKIERGDDLFRIMRRHFGDRRFAQERDALMAALRELNPHITDPDRIFAGDALVLPKAEAGEDINDLLAPLRGPDRIALNALRHEIARMPEESAQLISELNFEAVYGEKGTRRGAGPGMELATRVLDGGSGAFMTLVHRRLEAARPELERMLRNYREWDAKQITKGQYDYRRRMAVAGVDRQLGVLRGLLTPGRSSSEVLAISRNSGQLPTGNIENEIRTFRRVSSGARGGVFLLNVISLSSTAAQVRAASDSRERWSIVVERAGSLAGSYGGAKAGGGVALLLLGASGPLGWGAIAIVVGASAAGSVAGDAIGSRLFAAIGSTVERALGGNRPTRPEAYCLPVDMSDIDMPPLPSAIDILRNHDPRPALIQGHIRRP